MSAEVGGEHRVAGERGAPAVHRAPSVQARLSSALAVTLMSVLGLGALTWYYAHTMMRQNRARQGAQNAAVNRAEGDTTLPSLGRIEPPVPPPPAQASPATDTAWVPPDAPPEHGSLVPAALTEIPLSSPAVNGYGGAPPAKTPAQLAQDRELSGAVFAAPGLAAGFTTPAAPVAGTPPAPAATESGELAPLLRAGATAAVRAQVLPAQRLLLPKGAFIDCTLETAIDSTLPGMTTCVMATDAFGVDGKVVLLERGTKLIGETRGQVQQGAARVFVLWTEARTPTGVTVPLDSPGADELGRSGLPGEVNRHFWERFGAALLVSVIDGAVQTAAQSSGNRGGTVIIDPSSSQQVMTEVLKGTINIPPTVLKRNGDRISVLVARDVDFRSVYELRSVPPGR